MSAPYSYLLPEEKIADRPVRPYDLAKMLIAGRSGGALREGIFAELPSYLKRGDLLVFNDSRVIKARLKGKIQPGGGKAELLLLSSSNESKDIWHAMGRPMEKFSPGRRIDFGSDLSAVVIARESDRVVSLRFEGAEVESKLVAAGSMPIPPYIRGGRSDNQDIEDYQPHFSRVPGSVAAPTASLHFTPQLMSALQAAGIGTAFLTLHLGSASFLPVIDEAGRLTAPGAESFNVPRELLSRIDAVRAAGNRVIAVGTSVVRALESVVDSNAEFETTSLFIQPGYEFRRIDGLVTNFHQPGTTHLLLVEAFLGREILERSYGYALDNGFRFLSYGDGMLLLP